MSHRLSPRTTGWMPPGASRAHAGTSSSPASVATETRVIGSAGTVTADRGPGLVITQTAGNAVGTAGATATAGLRAAASAAAALVLLEPVTVRAASNRTVPMIAPTRTAAT